MIQDYFYSSSIRWVLLWLSSPAGALQFIPHSGHVSDVEGSEDEDDRGFLVAWLCFRPSSLLSLSRDTQEWQLARHSVRFSERVSQDFKSKFKAFRLFSSLSLNLSKGRPTFLGALVSSPHRSFLGARSSGIRTTWPTQRSWFLIKKDSIPGMSHFCRNSTFITLSYHLMRQIWRRQRMWKECVIVISTVGAL